MQKPAASSSGQRNTAGALDLRNIIGGLLGVYGVILTVMGVVADTESDRTGGVNANLWTGLVLLVVSAAFLLWARLKPLVVRPTAKQDSDATSD